MIRLCILLLAILGMAACARQQRTSPIHAAPSASMQSGRQQIAYLQGILAKAGTAEDSLTALTQAIASYADAGESGHINTEIWRAYPLAEKLHLCKVDSAKLLCGAAADLLINAIEDLTEWDAYAYNHGAPQWGLSHVTVLVRVNNKLVHADPNFGFIAYDAEADTLLDFINEIKYLKSRQPEKVYRKQLPFANDFLMCVDSQRVMAYASQLNTYIGADTGTGPPEIIKSTGLCPYKMKVRLTLNRWVTIQQGGKPYIKWLAEKGYPSIDYLLLFPLGMWGATNTQNSVFMNQYYFKLLQEIDG